MNRLDIPYVGNSGQACALACYTMVAKYFFPEVTFEEIGEVSRWKQGYAVWEMPFWNWIMERGVSVTDYDVIDYQAWAEQGLSGLKSSVPEKEFIYYETHTHNLDSYTADIQAAVQNPHFTQHKRNPTWDDLLFQYNNGAVCAAVLDARTLDNAEGFDLHQVVVLDITDNEITFHDPRGDGKERPRRTETHEHFKRAWLEVVAAPSLCAYKSVG